MTTIKVKGIFKGVVGLRRGIERCRSIFEVRLKCSAMKEWVMENLSHRIWRGLL